MAELRHKNYRELAEFCRQWNDDLFDPSKAEFREAVIRLSPTLTTALRQFMIEVSDYGMGLSGMTARDWFNDSYRAPYADALAQIYEAFQKHGEETQSAPNEVENALNEMRDMIKAQSEQIGKLNEAMMAKAEMEKEMGAEGEPDNKDEEDKEDEEDKDKAEDVPAE